MFLPFLFLSYLRQLFRNLFHKQGFTYDYVFDWNMLKFGGPRQDSASGAGNSGPVAAGGGANDASETKREREDRKHAGRSSSQRTPTVGAVGSQGAQAGVPVQALPRQMAPPELPFGGPGGGMPGSGQPARRGSWIFWRWPGRKRALNTTGWLYLSELRLHREEICD